MGGGRGWVLNSAFLARVSVGINLMSCDIWDNFDHLMIMMMMIALNLPDPMVNKKRNG